MQKKKILNPILITEFENKPGKGIKGKTDKNNLLAGNESFMLENKIDLSVVRNELKNEAIKNSSLIFLAIDGTLKGFVSVVDSVKNNSAEVIK